MANVSAQVLLTAHCALVQSSGLWHPYLGTFFHTKYNRLFRLQKKSFRVGTEYNILTLPRSYLYKRFKFIVAKSGL